MNSEFEIAGARAIGVQAKLPVTFWEARNLIDRERLIVVKLRTRGGTTGLSTVSNGDMPSTIKAIELFAQHVAGMHALDTVAVWQAMTQVTAIAPGSVAQHPLLSALRPCRNRRCWPPSPHLTWRCGA